MKCLLQRVSCANVAVDQEVIGEIEHGLLVYVGFGLDDDESQIDKAINKIIHLRIFSNVDGKLDLNVQQAGGKLLLVSQFTLYGSCERGRRPDFTKALAPARAEQLYNLFIQKAKLVFEGNVETGRFGADMQVSSINDGPLTFMLEF